MDEVLHLRGFAPYAVDELHAALAAHGLPVDGEHEADVAALAQAMVA